MKISPYDRLQALIRKPSYLKDIEELAQYFGFTSETIPVDELYRIKVGPSLDQSEILGHPFLEVRRRIEETEERYGLNYLVWPKTIVSLPTRELVASWGYWAFKCFEMVEMIPPPYDPAKSTRSLQTRGSSALLLWDRKYLLVKIDLSQPKEGLLREIENLLGIYRLGVDTTKGRARDNTIDVWQVYDMYEKERNFLQITKELFGIAKKPAYDIKADSRYRQVLRAYDKAKKIIQAVSPSHK